MQSDASGKPFMRPIILAYGAEKEQDNFKLSYRVGKIAMCVATYVFQAVTPAIILLKRAAPYGQPVKGLDDRWLNGGIRR